jgi:hypothetical protein
MSFDHHPLRVRPGRTPQWFRSRFLSGCLTVVLSAATAAGCGDVQPSGSSGIDAGSPGADSVGVPVVQNPAFDPEAPAAWRVGEELRVGSVDGELAFGRVSDVAPRSAGGMWVLDGLSRTVSGFDELGTLVLTFGRKGEGPGELRNPSRVSETTRGRIAITEAFPPVLHWFEADGSFRETVRVEASRNEEGTRSLPVLAEWWVGPDGTPFADVFAVPMPGREPRVRHSIIRLGGESSGAGVPDTLVRWSVPAPPTDPTADVEMVATTPQWSVGPGPVIWWTPGSPYELRSYGSAGELLVVAHLPREATPVTRELRAAIESDLRRSYMEGVAAGGAALEAVLERASWPDALPHLASIWVSTPGGRVFAAPFTSGMFNERPSLLIDVFERDGRYSGSLTLPAGFSPRRFADGAVFGVTTDELGVTYAVRYRLEEPE